MTPPAKDADTAPGGAVVAAIDFSAFSEAALLWAGRYAGQTGLSLVVLHIVHEPAEMPGYYERDPDNPDVPLKDLAERMMSSFLERIREENPKVSGLDDAEVMLVEGLPVEKILAVSEELGASLVVMGSQGRTGLPRVLIGSKAEKIVQMSKIPVTIVKMPSADEGDPA